MRWFHWVILIVGLAVAIGCWPRLASNPLFVAGFSIVVGGLLVRALALDWEHRYWQRQRLYALRAESIRVLNRAYQEILHAETHEEYEGGLPSQALTQAVKELSIAKQDIAFAFAGDPEVSKFIFDDANQIGFMSQDVLQDTKKRREYLVKREILVSAWYRVLWKGLKRS